VLNAIQQESNVTPQAPAKLIIASRESRLAMWQAEHVRDRLAALYPECSVEILGMTTRGDQILDRTLSKVGGKGLFVKELEVAMAEGRADLAVHSLRATPSSRTTTPAWMSCRPAPWSAPAACAASR
jgi:hydroxymethylbilane synthase